MSRPSPAEPGYLDAANRRSTETEAKRCEMVECGAWNQPTYGEPHRTWRCASPDCPYRDGREVSTPSG